MDRQLESPLLPLDDRFVARGASLRRHVTSGAANAILRLLHPKNLPCRRQKRRRKQHHRGCETAETAARPRAQDPSGGVTLRGRRGTLPQLPDNESSSPASAPIRDQPCYEKRVVLIIEDDEDTRVGYQEFLEILGFHLTSASTGAQAVEAVRENEIEAVLLDLSLPDIDGCVLRERLRELVSPRALPILALTGHDLEVDERAKLTAVMRKPVHLDGVAAWLREVAPSTPPGEAR